MKYRADIDGLRAIAVLTVVGFHAGVPFLGGGFAGVDVFFVISGFLIAGVIAEHQARGDYSLAGFWERRIRRIFPALMVMLAITSAAALFLLLPQDLVEYGQSMGAALLSVANLFFWQHTDYFATNDYARPLLHTWSLGVEEQFYLVFPLFMLLAAKLFPRGLRPVLAVLGIASLISGIMLAKSHPVVAFYMPFTRAWELLIGVLLALYRPSLPDIRLRNAAGVTGVAMILAACLLFDKETPWPGFAALLPSLGAALVILSEGGIAGRLLATRPMVWFGLISYSLYLWHWPLLTFQRLIWPSPWLAALAVLLSIGAAALSLRWVERPFRGSAFLKQWQVFAAGAAAIVVLGGLAAAMSMTQGLPQRFDARSQKIAHFQTVRSRGTYRSETCFMSAARRVERYRRDLCATPDKTRANWLLIGDSHAAAMWAGLAAASPDIHLMQATAAGCSLTVVNNHAEDSQCARMARLVYDDLIPATSPDGIVLAGRWWEDRAPGIAATLDWAKARGIPVVLIGPIPQYNEDVPRLAVLGLRLNDPDFANRRLVDWPRRSDEALRQIAREKGAPYVSLFDVLCDGARCRTMADPETPLQWDYGHLSPEGSVWLGRTLRERGLFPVRGPAPAPGPGSR